MQAQATPVEKGWRDFGRRIEQEPLNVRALADVLCVDYLVGESEHGASEYGVFQDAAQRFHNVEHPDCLAQYAHRGKVVPVHQRNT